MSTLKITIEGNIGTGKTVFLKYIESMLTSIPVDYYSQYLGKDNPPVLVIGHVKRNWDNIEIDRDYIKQWEDFLENVGIDKIELIEKYVD